MKAAAAGKPDQVEWIDLGVPQLGPGDVMLRPLACGICSTDLKQVHGGYSGGPRYALGHELVAEVVEVGDNARWQPGDQVVAVPYLPCGACYYCLHGDFTLCSHLFENSLTPGGLAERVHAPRQLAERGLFPLPAGVPLAHAALAEPIGCSVQGVEACRVSAGDTVLVVGDGPMGVLCAAVARAYGASPVMVSGMTPERLALAADHFADVVVDANQQDLTAAVKELTDGRGADAVLVAVSSAEALTAGLAALRPGGVLNAFAGVPHGTTVPLDLRQLHYQQIHLTGSFGVAPYHVVQALNLMESGLIDVAPMVTATFSFAETEQAVAYAAQRTGLKAVVTFEDLD